MKKNIFFILLTILCIGGLFSQSKEYTYSDYSTVEFIGPYLEIVEDNTNSLSIDDIILRNDFKNYPHRIPRFGISKSTFWAKFTLNNKSSISDFLLQYNKIDVDELVVYYKKNTNDNVFIEQALYATSEKYSGRLFLFDINIPAGEKRTIYIKFKTKWNVTFSVEMAEKSKILQQIFNGELISGIYFGILLIMVLYNMFIYFSIKDKSYLFYVIYISCFLLFQFNELGYAYKYLWYKEPSLYSVSAKLFPILTTCAAIFFIRDYLKTKVYTPKADKIFIALLVAMICCLPLVFNQKYNSSAFLILNILTLTISLYTLIIAINIYLKGFKPALFFLIAWSILLLSIIEFNLSNLGVIPYYPITDHALEIGSAIEVVLLSLGLANRINVLTKEKEQSQAEALQLATEKKAIIINQKDNLEQLVIERTKSLELKNRTILKQNEEKSTMMREIHHRVKNNLQMINSMIRLQTKYSSDNQKPEEVLQKVQRRILTMAQLHEKMYQSENLKSISIRDYLESIVDDLFNIYNEKNTQIELDISPNIKFEIETTLYLGLLVSELIINSLKHAFEEPDTGIILVKLQHKTQDAYEISVSDNGKGFDVNDFYQNSSLGQRLIQNFVKQLNGSMQINSNEYGSSFIVNFNLIN